ncbi:MAG: hypothetical protein ACR2QQ_11835 [Gammaproteobacteria bacterium]
MIRYSLSCMQPDDPIRNPQRRGKTGLTLALAIVVVTGLSVAAVTATSQETELQARVFTSYANVHDGPSTNNVPLVLVPEGTVLPLLSRRGEWIEVGLSPELRETGMVVRWYQGRHEIIRRGVLITVGDEESGWMHDSTVEISEVE